jgi:hypothetical protein
MKKYLFIVAIILTLVPNHCLQGQKGSCPRIKVGVQISEVYPEVFEYLNKQSNVEKHRAVWLSELGGKLMESLRNNSPEIEFIYLSTAIGDPDYDYLFKTWIALIGGGAGIEVYPAGDIIVGDKIFKTDPMYTSEWTDYWICSSLIVNSHCYPNRRYILKIELDQNRDINQAIANNLAKFWRLINIIEARENERPVPPREPKVETRLEKEYMSPLSEETRKMKIYENVKSCNGKPAYFLFFHSQPVRFPSKTDRGEIVPVEGCKLEKYNPEIQYILVNQAGDAVGEYRLKRGLEPLLEKFTLSTCPLGNKPNIEKEVDIIIRGLELKVEPDRKSISIDLHEIDPDGNLYPVNQKEVKLKISGLVDGSISPKDKVTTDDMGLASINYTSGKQDKEIKISATFTLPGYPDEVKGDATISVKQLEYEASLTIRGKTSIIKNSSKEKRSNNNYEKSTYNFQEIREASFYVPLKMESAEDIPVYNQRWEYYHPLDISLSFSASYRSTKFDHGEYGDHGYKTTHTVTGTPADQQIVGKETFLITSFIVIIDKKTNKAVKVALTGYPVAFKWNKRDHLYSVQWSPDKGEKLTDKTEMISEDDEFDPGPVEDLIPDPTAKSLNESMKTYFKEEGIPLPANIKIPEDDEIQEIQPDLLVKFGDGKTYFGGEGKKIIDRSEGGNIDREENSFFWQITRKKKPL